jgi:hypothetical protein
MKRRTVLLKMLSAMAILATCAVTLAQPAACPAGYRVLSRHYDSELRKIWELRQDCAHPTWPAFSAAVANSALLAGNSTSLPLATVINVQPLLVHAGENVRLWSQDTSARIEINGVAEQSAHLGEHINVRITHQTDENGLTIQHIAGVVRAADSVEMSQ